MEEERDYHNLKLKKLQAIQREAWKNDPLLWLEERLGEDRKAFVWTLFPEYAKHTWDGDRNPLAEAWRDIAQFKWVGVEAATGTSKTYLLARVVLWFLDVHEDSLVVTSAPKQDQLKLHLWSEITKIFHKFKKIRGSAEMLDLKLRVDGRVKDIDEQDLSESWIAKGFVSGVGSGEDSATKAQGFHREHMLIILEETPGMEQAVMTAFQNTSTGNKNVILAVGNPDSELDVLHQFCELKQTKHYRVSALDYPNVVLDREIFPGAVTRRSIQRRKDQYTEESGFYKSRVRGISPAEGENSLIRLEWVNQCVDSPVERLEGAYTYNAVGVDVSNSESGDKASLAWFDGSNLAHVEEFHCKNATHLAYNLVYSSAELMNRKYTDYGTHKISQYNIINDCIGIDAVGVGTATVNGFIDMGMHQVKALQGGQWEEAIPQEEYFKNGGWHNRPMYKFNNLRTQMYWELREDLRLKQINVTIQDPAMLLQLKKELVTPKFELSDNTIMMERKEKIKKRQGGKSPNVADAVAYANWVRKGYRKEEMSLPMYGGE